MSVRLMGSFLFTLLLCACVTRLTDDDSYRLQLEQSRQEVRESAEIPPVYMRKRGDGSHPLLLSTVQVNFPPGKVALQTVLVQGLGFPVTVIAMDEGVDLQLGVSVRSEGVTVRSFLEQIEGVTGYDLVLWPERATVEVASLVVKTWTLPAMAGMSRFRARIGFEESADGNDAGTAQGTSDSNRSHDISARIDHEEDAWKHLVDYAHCLLETFQCTNNQTDNRSGNQPQAPVVTRVATAWLADNPRLGMITASAPPRKIAVLDTWLQKTMKQSQRLVRLECLILDLNLRKSSEKGLDFDVIFGDEGSRLLFGYKSEGSLQEGLSVGGEWLRGEFSLDFILKSLAKHADVKIKSRIHLAVTNGATAYLNTGEVFSYISNAGSVANNGVTTTTFEQGRLQVGLELAVTPRFLEGSKKMLIEVIPVLSSLVRFDVLGVGDSRVSAPVIALRQMTSQALTVSGRPITIGGLSSSRLAKSSSHLFSGKGLLDYLIGEHQDVSEDHELLIVITPREVVV